MEAFVFSIPLNEEGRVFPDMFLAAVFIENNVTFDCETQMFNALKHMYKEKLHFRAAKESIAIALDVADYHDTAWRRYGLIHYPQVHVQSYAWICLKISEAYKQYASDMEHRLAFDVFQQRCFMFSSKGTKIDRLFDRQIRELVASHASLSFNRRAVHRDHLLQVIRTQAPKYMFVVNDVGGRYSYKRVPIQITQPIPRVKD